jgi:capsular exopolysaccharide synthesis family protein
MIVTSLGPAHGKTSLVSNLAIAMTEVGRRVLMIDADLRSPRLHKTFGVPNSQGLTNIISGKEPIEEVAGMITPTEIPNLSLLASGPYTEASSSTLFHSPRMSELFAALRQSFDTILVDTPPLMLSDARMLGPLADGVIIVLRAGQVRLESVLAAEERLAEDGSRVIGTVLNNWDPRANGYGSYPNRYDKHAYSQPASA